MDRMCRRLAVLVLLSFVVACTDVGAGRERVVDKAGGEVAPTTLLIGTDDQPGFPSAAQIEHLAGEVTRRSGGDLVIEPVWKAAGHDIPDWDQEVARLVVAGDLDMGMVPARAWATEGVTSLRALHAPFLVTTDELVARIVTTELGARMLAGLQGTGVRGLALVPEGMRHIFLFGEPPQRLTELGGRIVRVPRSETAFATFEALGGRPDDLAGADAFPRGIEDGSVIAAESSYALAGHLPAPTTAVGDVAVFPKVNSLVVNDEAFDALTDAQQDALEASARSLVAWSVEDVADDDELAEQYCDDGGRIIAVSADMARLRQAVEPVYDTLRDDPTTARLLDEIESLGARMPPPATLTCTSVLAEVTTGPTGSESTDDLGALDGVYRYEVTEQHLLSYGVPAAQAEQEAGVHTVTLDGGTFVDEWNTRDEEGACAGTYTVRATRATFTWSSGCYGDWTMVYSRSDTGLHWRDVQSLPPHDDPASQAVNVALNSVPWVRVD